MDDKTLSNNVSVSYGQNEGGDLTYISMRLNGIRATLYSQAQIERRSTAEIRREMGKLLGDLQKTGWVFISYDRLMGLFEVLGKRDGITQMSVPVINFPAHEFNDDDDD